MMSDSVRSIACVVEDEKARREIIFFDKVRDMTLDKVCSIPGYRNLTRREKNRVYDAVKARVTAELLREVLK